LYWLLPGRRLITYGRNHVNSSKSIQKVLVVASVT
jgi:hypothetical protein